MTKRPCGRVRGPQGVPVRLYVFGLVTAGMLALAALALALLGGVALGRGLGGLAGGLLAAFLLFVILYMAGVSQWVCIGLGVTAASAVVWLTFRLNAKYGQHGLMKLGAARMRPRYLLHRRRVSHLLRRKKKGGKA